MTATDERRQVKSYTHKDIPIALMPAAPVIEIVEAGRATDDSAPGSVISPDTIRVNGVELLTAPDWTIGHLGNGEVATVTVTLYARKIVIAAAGDINGKDAP